jgi:hypothetical protein
LVAGRQNDGRRLIGLAQCQSNSEQEFSYHGSRPSMEENLVYSIVHFACTRLLIVKSAAAIHPPWHVAIPGGSHLVVAS